jgi:hypothetical protein
MQVPKYFSMQEAFLLWSKGFVIVVADKLSCYKSLL